MNQAQNLKPNKDIRDILQKYKITYVELLEFIPNFSHVQRIYEELNKPLTEERKKVYLLAIEKIKDKKRRFYEN